MSKQTAEQAAQEYATNDAGGRVEPFDIAKYNAHMAGSEWRSQHPTDNKHLPAYTQHMKERAEKLANFFGYNSPTLTTIDMREMYCQGYLQAIQDAKPSRISIAAMCLQGLLANPATPIDDLNEHHFALLATQAADALLTHLSNTEQ